MQGLRWSVVLVVLSVFLLSIPVQAQELDGTYEDQLIVFDYPTDWFFCECPPEEPVVIMGSTEAVVSTHAPQKGEVQLIIVKSVADFLRLSGSNRSLADLDAKGVLALFNNDSPLGIKAVPGTDAYSLIREGDTDTLFMVMPMEDGVFGMVLATTPSGELEPFMDTLVEIGMSMHLPEITDIELPTELEERYRKNGVRFDYPEGWIVQESGEMLIIASDERLLMIDALAELRDGQYLVVLYPTLDSLHAEGHYPIQGGGNATSVSEVLWAFGSASYGLGHDTTFHEVDGRSAVAMIMTATDHERLVLTIDSEDGDDVSTMMVYGELDNLEVLRELMIEMLGTIEAR